MEKYKPAKCLFMSKPILPALAVDAACSGNPGVMEFRGVIADTGTEVFHRGPFQQGTNNIGEFLALVLGLASLLHPAVVSHRFADVRMSWSAIHLVSLAV